MIDYTYHGTQDLKLIPQENTRVHEFQGELDHNSTWDTTMGPDGKLYMSMSSELKDMGFARLYEYDYKTDTERKLVDVEDLLTPQYRALRPSKFHTSISFMKDGRLAMTTHSTDKGPAHPTWMPFSYFGHVWEGFSGSTVITYDFKTGKPEIMGVPAPRESLYGSCYDAKHNAFWSMGFMKGHLYRFDFDTRQVRDFGKVTESGSFRLCVGPDGNIYSASKSGYAFMIDTDAQKVVDLNTRLPMGKCGEDGYQLPAIGNFSDSAIGPDGLLYVAIMHGPDLIAIDTKTKEIKNLGPYINTKRFAETETTCSIFGMDFDSRGRLWYAVDTFNDGTGKPNNPDGLYCWDITKAGSRPEFKGIIGVPGRISACVSELWIHNDTILMTDQNHGRAATAVFVVGIDQFDRGAKTVAIDPNGQADKMFHTGDPEQLGYSRPFLENGAICAANPNNFDGNLSEAYRLWRETAPDMVGESAVRTLRWADKDTLTGLCGIEKEFYFEIRDGKLGFLPAEKADPAKTEALHRQLSAEVNTGKGKLPWYPGRQYEAVGTCETEMADGAVLVGTQDGLLAIVKGNKVYSLGMAGYNGPVRDLTASPDGKTVYGTAGDEEDLGMVFRYTEEKGLELLGNIQHMDHNGDGILASNVLSACRISPDGKKLAIGSADRLGTVYIYSL